LSNVYQMPRPAANDPMAAVRLFVQANPMVYVSQGGKFWVKTDQEGWQAQTPSATYGLDPMFMGDGNASRKYRQALQAVLQDHGHIYKRCAYTFRDDLPSDTFNLMDTSDWLDPEDGQHHVAFDILMISLCNGDEEAIDHIKRVVAWKRLNPEDSYTLPCCVLYGEGGTGKNTLVDRVLYTMFARQTITTSADKILKKFNAIIQGMTVVACNEKEQDDVSPSAIKNALHQERIVVEKKGIDGFQADNLSLMFIFSNRKDGGVWLDRSDADRRMSLIYVPKQEPRLTLRHHIARRLGLSESDTYKWLKEVALPIYASKHEVAKWLGHLFLTCDLSTQPTAFHGASYDDVMERQKPFFEQFCEAVFLDRMIDGKQYTFDYINETTAYAGYAALCRSLNNGRGIMGIRTFRPDLRDWLGEHAPHIVRKEKWQGYSQADHVRLWFNTRHLEKLSLEDNNDTKYLIGDPGRESWVGPSV
jgi:hypothetical protein